MKQKVAPSLMAMDLMNVQEQIEGLNPYAYYYHVDVIDWHYARNMCCLLYTSRFLISDLSLQ